MATVNDLMSSKVITIPHFAAVDAAIELILSHNISALAVVDDHGKLLGVISEYDVLQLFGKSTNSDTALDSCAKYMTSPVKTISPHASLEVVAKIFKAASIRRLFVVDGDQLVGIIARRDVLRHIRNNRHGLRCSNEAATARLAQVV